VKPEEVSKWPNSMTYDDDDQSATSNFRSLTFSLWWIYSGMTNTLKPSTIACSTIACSGIVCVWVYECTQASMCLKNHMIFIYIMDIFLQWINSYKPKNSLESYEMKKAQLYVLTNIIK
jgi:hypothetical protein